MPEYLDEVLATLEEKPLSEQSSELMKNNSAGYPSYIRGVVMTKAHYDALVSRITQAEAKPTLSYSSMSDAFHFGKWTITEQALSDARQRITAPRYDAVAPSYRNLSDQDRVYVSTRESNPFLTSIADKVPPPKKAERPAPPKWWEDGGWD